MKKIGELMKELGFNPQASEGAQKAFIQHLIKVNEQQSKLVPLRPEIIRTESTVDSMVPLASTESSSADGLGVSTVEKNNLQEQLSLFDFTGS